MNTDLILILAILLLIGASAKSAQLGLHSWLASAMEGKQKIHISSRSEENYEITSYQKQVIIGLLLSDGHISKANRLEMTFKSSTIDFIRWLKFTI